MEERGSALALAPSWDRRSGELRAQAQPSPTRSGRAHGALSKLALAREKGGEGVYPCLVGGKGWLCWAGWAVPSPGMQGGAPLPG